MATIGRNVAIAQFPSGKELKGFIGWLAWIFVHIMVLVGFRSRLSVMSSWAWSYLTNDRASRLILPKGAGALVKYKVRPEQGENLAPYPGKDGLPPHD